MRAWEDYKKTMRAEDVLFALARAGDAEGLKQYLRAAPDAVDRQDHKGYTALMLAAYHGHEGAVTALLAAGADPGVTDHGGGTILMGAAFKGHTRIVEALIAAGAAVDAVNSKGHTALAYAQMFGRAEAARSLQSRQRRAAAFGLREVLSGWHTFFFAKRTTR